jgi:serine/threonine protein kinase
MKLPNRYSIKDANLGGGMGDVFECIDNHLDRKVVLKLLRSGEENRRLLDEQKALIKLRSKHVVQLHDIIKVNKNPLQIGLILEHIEGHDLKRKRSINPILKNS